MKRFLCNAMACILFWSVLMVMGGCGSGGGALSEDSGEDTGLITGVGWFFQNSPADMDPNGATCLLTIQLGYNPSLSASDIESWSVISPDGVRWNIPLAESSTGTFTSGDPFVARRLYYGANRAILPLAGTWTVILRLKDGKSSLLQGDLAEPGSDATPTHSYVYSPEEWTPPANSPDYIAALKRIPAQGYTATYSAAGAGKITTTGFAAVKSAYFAAEPVAYNFYCLLFDQDNKYLGYTGTAYSLNDHSPTALLTPQGELSIAQEAVTFDNGAVDLSRVKYLRVVASDGAQFAPSGTLRMRYGSISGLVPVN